MSTRHAAAIAPAVLAGSLLAGVSAAQDWPWPGPPPDELRQARIAEKRIKTPTENDLKKLEAACPDVAPAKPKAPRKVLVWGRLWTHEGNVMTVESVKALGRKTGAFEAVGSDDVCMLLPEKLGEFDCLFLNSIHEAEPFLPENFKQLPEDKKAEAREFDARVKQSIVDFVSNGKGVAAVHGATAALQSWPPWGEILGDYHTAHTGGKIVMKNDDPGHPVNACFEGQGFTIGDEVYLFWKVYSRKKLRVLLSMDMTQMKDPKDVHDWIKGRPDKDYAISWVKTYGKGRVFHTTMGHAWGTYINPLFLRHVLAGTQFAIGDLEADASPSEKQQP